MSRWQPGARERLERAALELFVEQGFAATTVSGITARAGLTTRTFFRHYADKREVLFAGDDAPALAARLIADAPSAMEPMTLITEGLRTVIQARFEGRRDELRVRRTIVGADEGLGERELRKRAELSQAIRSGFQDRGLGLLEAAVAADVAVTGCTSHSTGGSMRTTPGRCTTSSCRHFRPCGRWSPDTRRRRTARSYRLP